MVGDENARAPAQQWAAEGSLEQMVRRVRVDCGKDVVQQDKRGRGVEGPSEGESSFLSSCESDAAYVNKVVAAQRGRRD